MILNSDIAPTEVNNLHSYFYLSVYWSGVWNDQGYLKENRLALRAIWPGDDWDVASKSLFIRMSNLDENPSAARKIVIDTAILALKATGLWVKFVTLWTTAAHGIESAKLNWIADSINITDGVAPFFTTDRGFQGNGTSMYLKTNFVPTVNGSNYKLNDAAFGVYTRIDIDESKVICGMKNGTPSLTYSTYLFLRDGNKSYAIIQALGTNIIPANNDSRGLFIVSRNAANEQNIYVRGAKTSNATASGALENNEMYLLGYNGDGVLSYMATNQIAFFFTSSKLTDADVANINTIIVDGYLNSVGAKI